MWMSEPLRRAGADDAAACAGIVSDWIAATDWMPERMTREALTQVLAEGLPRREAWVIGDPVAGYLSMDGAEGHIWGFYVARPGTGLGKRLLDRAKEGRAALRLNTHLANRPAQAFYRREGFAVAGDPWIGDDGIEEIRMEWRA
jgi:putative acetyltransferase